MFGWKFCCISFSGWICQSWPELRSPKTTKKCPLLAMTWMWFESPAMTCWDNKMFRHFVLRYEARNVFWHVTFANSPNEISLNFSQRNHLDAVSPNSKIIPQMQIWILPSSIVFFGHFWMFLVNLSYFTNLGFPEKYSQISLHKLPVGPVRSPWNLTKLQFRIPALGPS